MSSLRLEIGSNAAHNTSSSEQSRTTQQFTSLTASKRKKKRNNMACTVTKQSKITYDLPVHDRNMFQRTSGCKKASILPTLEKANVTIDLNGKTTSCDGMQPAQLKRTTSHLVPHLGGVAASIGTLNCAGAYTLARACASAL